MRQAVKDQWIAALLSDEYQQGQQRLHRRSIGNGETYCCLGVLCDLAFRAGIVGKQASESEVMFSYGDADGGWDHTELPFAVQRWAELDSSNPSVITGENHSTSLAQLNDGGMPFDEIAEIIEDQL